ncbi:MutS-related protein [Thermus islandicus]|uniref:MutS-related protein n=1 Tax=Thermus islandicus TaxID=540988 RepID=UPI0003B3D2FB|nr:DNA mismatch repair protein MutS [Thermus islandicus]
MRVGLLFPDRDLRLNLPLPFAWEDLEQDLGLKAVLEAMAEGDNYLEEVARKVLAQGLTSDLSTILYRQGAVREALEKRTLLETIYVLCGETLVAKRRQAYGLYRRDRPDLYGAIKGMEALLGGLKQLLRHLEGAAFTSPPFRGLQARLREVLTPVFFREAEEHLEGLRFPKGVWLAAGLDPEGRGQGYTLLPPEGPKPWRPFAPRPKTYLLTLHPRDEAGARILGELRERGILEAAKALAAAVEEVARFFEALRAEVGFLLGAARLAQRLKALGLPVTFPTPTEGLRLAFKGLYDVGLALRQGRAVGNDLEAHDKNPILITGANRGGKTTFLRSLGLAQLLMQAGLFVGAEGFESSLVDGIFTHFKREEDRALEAGKFEEELRRMDNLVNHLSRKPLLLFNESFGATNEPEGAELGAQVVRALVEHGVRVAFVTHFYTLAVAFLGDPKALFLKAERLSDGRRTYRLRPEPPEPTAWGQDLLRQVFGEVSP